MALDGGSDGHCLSYGADDNASWCTIIVRFHLHLAKPDQSGGIQLRSALECLGIPWKEGVGTDMHAMRLDRRLQKVQQGASLSCGRAPEGSGATSEVHQHTRVALVMAAGMRYVRHHSRHPECQT